MKPFKNERPEKGGQAVELMLLKHREKNPPAPIQTQTHVQAPNLSATTTNNNTTTTGRVQGKCKKRVSVWLVQGRNDLIRESQHENENEPWPSSRKPSRAVAVAVFVETSLNLSVF